MADKITEEDKKKVVEAAKAGRPNISYKSEAAKKEEEIQALKDELEGMNELVSAMTGQPAELTVGGKPIPADVQHLIPYANTDQGIAEANARLEEQGRLSNTGVRMKADAADKAIEQFAREDVVSPLVEAAAEYREKNPDKKVRYLSEVTMKLRGKRGFEFVKDDQGRPITVGDLQLASISRQEADRRRKEAVQMSEDAVGDAIEEFQVKTENVNRANPGGKTVVQPMVGSELEGSRGWKATKTWGANT